MFPYIAGPSPRPHRVLTATIHTTVLADGFEEINWNTLECTGTYWNALECTGMYWNALESITPPLRLGGQMHP